MHSTLEAGIRAWLDTAGLALFAVLAAYLVSKFVVLLVNRFSEDTSVARVFFDVSARALVMSLCLLALNGVLQTAPGDLPLLKGLQQLTTVLLVISLTWAAARTLLEAAQWGCRSPPISARHP